MEKPKPHPTIRKTGILVMPKFVRGAPPAHQWRPPPKPSPWEEHFKLCREHPGRRDNDAGWAIVSEVRKKGRAESNSIIKRDRLAISDYLRKHHPLERWQLQIVTVKDTWADKELYLRYLGEVTPEQDAADRIARRARYDAMQAKAAERKAERALAARAEALREQARLRPPTRRRG